VAQSPEGNNNERNLKPNDSTEANREPRNLVSEYGSDRRPCHRRKKNAHGSADRQQETIVIEKGRIDIAEKTVRAKSTRGNVGTDRDYNRRFGNVGV